MNTAGRSRKDRDRRESRRGGPLSACSFGATLLRQGKANYYTPDKNSTKVEFHWKMPLKIHWTIPVKIHWKSDNPFGNTTDK